jgi:hypothetical protein
MSVVPAWYHIASSASSISTEPVSVNRKNLTAAIDPPRAAPDADDEEHRDQHALEEHVEHDEVGAQNMPTIIVSRMRKAIMYSRTRGCGSLPARQDADRRQHVDSSTNSTEMPSTPIL